MSSHRLPCPGQWPLRCFPPSHVSTSTVIAVARILFMPHLYERLFDFLVFWLLQPFQPLFCDVSWATGAGVALEMYPWGLGSPPSMEFRSVSGCGFLWWSLLAEKRSFFDEGWYLYLSEDIRRDLNCNCELCWSSKVMVQVDCLLRSMASLNRGSRLDF